MTAYYNEIDPFCCSWLSNLMDAELITHGKIDDRSIHDVCPDDLTGYERVHFFAGIGGWDSALNLAGWDGAVWTGSCPCQPFSIGGKGEAFADDRHLWPSFYQLIRQCQPPVVFGEQVASAAGVLWADAVAQDLEATGYAFGTAILPASSVGAGHQRDRFYFVANTSCANAGRRIADGWGLQVASEDARPWSYADWNGGRTRHRVLADGIPSRVAKAVAGGFGNSIVPDLAAEFITAADEAMSAAAPIISDGAAREAGSQRGISRTSEIQPARAGAGSWAKAQTVLAGVAPGPSDTHHTNHGTRGPSAINQESEA